MSAGLATLRDVVASLDRAGVPYWVHGAWAQDFHAGLRAGGDASIELVVWSHDADDAVAALHDAGFVSATDTRLDRDGAAVELELVETDLAGSVLSVEDGAEWPAGALGGERATLDGVSCRVVSAEAASWRS